MPDSDPATDRSAFLAEAARGAEAFGGRTFIPLSKRWPADLETPLSTWLKVGAGGRQGVLLESVEGGERLGRWSVVVGDPLWTLTCRGKAARRQWRDGRSDDLQGNPFDLLRQCLAPLRPATVPELPPLGQLFGAWGYELIRWVEPSVPVHAPAPGDPPDGNWMLADSLLVFDQVKRQITAVAYVNLTEQADAAEAWDRAAGQIAALEARMHAPLPPEIKPLQWHDHPGAEVGTTANRSREDFEASQRIIADPVRLPHTIADEKNLFASHANPICSIIEESDSPMGPNGEATHLELRYGD